MPHFLPHFWPSMPHFCHIFGGVGHIFGVWNRPHCAPSSSSIRSSSPPSFLSHTNPQIPSWTKKHVPPCIQQSFIAPSDHHLGKREEDQWDGRRGGRGRMSKEPAADSVFALSTPQNHPFLLLYLHPVIDRCPPPSPHNYILWFMCGVEADFLLPSPIWWIILPHSPPH